MPESWSSKSPLPVNGRRPVPAGYVYDSIFLQHDTGTHVENARRLSAIMSDLDRKGIRQQLLSVPARPATQDELALVHRPDYISRVQEYCRQGGGWWDADTVMSPSSYDAALYAAGGTIAAVEAVIRGDVRSVYALVRPPGHHATSGDAMGFCLFNNIAVAASYALKELGLERGLIIDFDVHHGNGTQEAFLHNPYILYISMHQYPLFPGTGHIEETGQSIAEGTVINIPMPAGCGDTEYARVFEEIVVPAARRFQPELVLASAGYDGHWVDEISHMRLTLTGYNTIAGIINDLALELSGGRTVFCLEGGYDLRVLAAAVNNTFRIWLGEDYPEDPLGLPPSHITPHGIDDIIAAVKSRHGLY